MRIWKLGFLFGCLFISSASAQCKQCEAIEGLEDEPCYYTDNHGKARSIDNDKDVCKCHQDRCCWNCRDQKCRNTMSCSQWKDEPCYFTDENGIAQSIDDDEKTCNCREDHCVWDEYARKCHKKIVCPAIPGWEDEPCYYTDRQGITQSIDNDERTCDCQQTRCCWDNCDKKCRNKISCSQWEDEPCYYTDENGKAQSIDNNESACKCQRDRCRWDEYANKCRNKISCPPLPGWEGEPCYYTDERGITQSIDNDELACNGQQDRCCWDICAQKCRNKMSCPQWEDEPCYYTDLNGNAHGIDNSKLDCECQKDRCRWDECAKKCRNKISCPPRQGDVGCTYIDENGHSVSAVNTETDCANHCRYCIWDECAKKCRNKITGTLGPMIVVRGGTFNIPDVCAIDEKLTINVQARNLVILNPLCIPNDPLPFPSGCKYTRNEPYVLYPPTNVPYCVRIPCSLDTFEQRQLDTNHFKCGSTPGCYFDVELYEYREAFGPAVLAGVPVCHLAIRNSVFLREASRVRSELGSWNPYFTNCLLNTFHDEINEGPPGCVLIPLLTTFDFLPKLAGWEGITSKECVLIDGCWSELYGCQYPVDVNNLIVKSGQRFLFNKFDVVYGRPKCQHFNMENSYEILKSYHRCLASGCAVDVTISANYYKYLFDIGEQMSVRDHWYYWAAVLRDEIGSFNLDTDVYWKYDRSFSRSLETDETPTTIPPSNPFNNPFLFIPSGRRKRQASSSQACGLAFRAYGYRPCRPVSPPNFRQNTDCPYKPPFVPRFKPLKGSFIGCCEISHCYISRQDIRNMHSGPSIYYTEWSKWEDCSIPCGFGGKQKRRRKCVSHDKDLCDLDTEETRSCGGQCSEWTKWGPWIPPCRPGRGPRCTQSKRTRRCRPDPNGCEGKGVSEENKTCNCHSNPFVG